MTYILACTDAKKLKEFEKQKTKHQVQSSQYDVIGDVVTPCDDVITPSGRAGGISHGGSKVKSREISSH